MNIHGRNYRIKQYLPGEEKILKLITGNPSITTHELAEGVGLSIKGIEKAVRLLKKQGRLRRIGPDKGGHWEVIG